jgi:hypothetical protein
MNVVKTPRIACAIMLLLGMFFGVRASAEESMPLRRIGVNTRSGELVVSFSYRDAFTTKVKQKLNSGLTTSVVVQLTIERQGKKQPVSYWVRTVEVTYDLWEETFYVLREDNSGRRRAKVASKTDVIDLAGTMNLVPIVSLADLENGVFRIRAKIETNPVSKEMVQTIRSWLARSRAKKSGNLAPSNYFGSFVGALVDRRISQAEHTVEFVSQWFKLRAR